MNNNEIRYETKELGPPICDESNKIEIDKMMLNECFFSELDLDDEDDGFHNNMNDELNDDDNLIAQHVDYFENYTLKMLHHIVNYYEIPKRRLKKEELIELIIQFENESENSLNVYNRKRCWHYIHELQNDTYFGKFISFH
jgi:hypothetical protein|tara:strand:+ start:2685 stop:3107 length:423 start_codon:yes stop_codon:yes gene_type:complete